jgi:hypothetical protein
MVYLLNMVIFHGYVSHNQMVYEIPIVGWMTIADPCSFPARPEPGASHAFFFLNSDGSWLLWLSWHALEVRGVESWNHHKHQQGDVVKFSSFCQNLLMNLMMLTQTDCDLMTMFRALMIFDGSSSAENMVQMDHLLSKLMLPAVAMCLCILQPCRLCASFRSSKVCSRDYSLIIQVESVYLQHDSAISRLSLMNLPSSQDPVYPLIRAIR